MKRFFPSGFEATCNNAGQGGGGSGDRLFPSEQHPPLLPPKSPKSKREKEACCASPSPFSPSPLPQNPLVPFSFPSVRPSPGNAAVGFKERPSASPMLPLLLLRKRGKGGCDLLFGRRMLKFYPACARDGAGSAQKTVIFLLFCKWYNR